MDDESKQAGLGQNPPAEAKKPYAQILQEEINEGWQVFRRPYVGTFLSALSAGLDIGFSLFVMAILRTMLTGEREALLDFVTANAYAIGFLFVVLGRSELFTEQTTLAVLPVLNGKASLAQLGGLWTVVYAGNLLGTAAFAALIVVIGPRLGIIESATFGAIAEPVVAPPALSIFLSAVLAGWLMGLMSWLVTAARDTVSQILIVWIVAFCIGIAHLHHPIVSSVEVLAGIFAGQGVTLADYGHFLLWATLGTATGGTVFVALLKYAHAVQAPPPRPETTSDGGTMRRGRRTEAQQGARDES